MLPVLGVTDLHLGGTNVNDHGLGNAGFKGSSPEMPTLHVAKSDNPMTGWDISHPETGPLRLVPELYR
jgi:hypothetical protein